MALVATGHIVFISGCEGLTLPSATSQLIGSLRLLNSESSASPTLSVGLAGSMLGHYIFHHPGDLTSIISYKLIPYLYCTFRPCL